MVLNSITDYDTGKEITKLSELTDYKVYTMKGMISNIEIEYKLDRVEYIINIDTTGSLWDLGGIKQNARIILCDIPDLSNIKAITALFRLIREDYVINNIKYSNFNFYVINTKYGILKTI